MQDDFLYSKVEGSKNLPVPISIIHSFKRMRHYQPLSVVVAALKESTTLNVVDNDACVQRKDPLDVPDSAKDKPIEEVKKVYQDKTIPRSIYVKGFGEEGPGTQFELEAFFADFGATNSVRLRRHSDKLFKGSVFVEFDAVETQEKFLALDPKPKWKGNDLIIKSKKQYCDEKVEDINSGRIKPNVQRDEQRNHNKGSRQGPDTRDWRTRRDEDQANGFKDRKGKGHHEGRGQGKGRRNWRDEQHKEQDNDQYVNSKPSMFSLFVQTKKYNPSSQSRFRPEPPGPKPFPKLFHNKPKELPWALRADLSLKPIFLAGLKWKYKPSPQSPFTPPVLRPKPTPKPHSRALPDRTKLYVFNSNPMAPVVRPSTSSPTRAGADESMDTSPVTAATSTDLPATSTDPPTASANDPSTAPSTSQPEASSSTAAADPATTSSPPGSSKKRAREDDDGEEPPVSKKANTNGEQQLT